MEIKLIDDFQLVENQPIALFLNLCGKYGLLDLLIQIVVNMKNF